MQEFKELFPYKSAPKSNPNARVLRGLHLTLELQKKEPVLGKNVDVECHLVLRHAILRILRNPKLRPPLRFTYQYDLPYAVANLCKGLPMR